jgi:hypothetical protein
MKSKNICMSKFAEKFAIWIASSGRPINIVADFELENVFKYITGDDSFKMPSRYIIQNTLNEIATRKNQNTKRTF